MAACVPLHGSDQFARGQATILTVGAIPFLPTGKFCLKRGVTGSDPFAVNFAGSTPIFGTKGGDLAVHSEPLSFRGRKENEHHDFFFDVVEVVRNFSSYVDHAAGGNFSIFPAGLEATASAHHVVHFVFMMRPLRIGASRR